MCDLWLASVYLDLDLYLSLDSMVLISAFAGFNLCWFVVHFRFGCCTTTWGKGRLCQQDYALLFAIFAGFNCANFNICWIQLVVNQFALYV